MKALLLICCVTASAFGSGCYAAVRPAYAAPVVYTNGYYARPGYYHGGGYSYGYARPVPVYRQGPPPRYYQRPGVEVRGGGGGRGYQAPPRNGGPVVRPGMGMPGNRGGSVEVRGR